MAETTQDSTVVETASQEEGTTSRLFPELLPQSTTPDGKVEAETKKGIPVEKKAEIPPQPKYLDVYEFGDAMIKAKVDGIELDVPVKDVVRAYQTDKYLTQKGQRIAEEARRMKEKEQEMANLNVKSTTEAPIEEDGLYKELIKPHTELLSKQILSLSEEVRQMKEKERIIEGELAPVRYEKAMSIIDDQMKKEGLTDFKQKLPAIEKIMLAMPQDRMAEFDNPAGFETLYKRLKLDELVRKEQASVAAVKSKIVPIDSSSSPSNADTSGNDRVKDMARAKKTGDWTDFMVKYG